MSAETFFPDKITFIGSRDQDLISMGGHYSEYWAIFRHFLELPSTVFISRQKPNFDISKCPIQPCLILSFLFALKIYLYVFIIKQVIGAHY